jgi:lipid-A-disaccharide synthase
MFCEERVSEEKTLRRAMIVTGEASGDLHGAGLIRSARAIDPGLSFFGVGGPCMAAEGCEIVIPTEELAVMGLVEVFRHLPVLWRAFKKLKSLLRGRHRPDVLVLIDFQEFNLMLARQARRAGVPVLFYIGPTVWAWRRGRVKAIARAVDRLAVIFPFEPAYYADEDIAVEYVGHPLLDQARVIRERGDFLQELGLDPARPVVGLFPGSRKSELRYNLPAILEAAGQVLRQIPAAQFLLPVASSFTREYMQDRLGAASVSVRLVQESIYDTINACDAILSVSGTVTLQIALIGTPMAIIYKTAALNYAIGRRVVKVAHIGLVNIVAGREVVREFIQHEASAENLAGEIVKILKDADYNAMIRRNLAGIRREMGEPGCSRRVALMVSEMSRRAERRSSFRDR